MNDIYTPTPDEFEYARRLLAPATGLHRYGIRDATLAMLASLLAEDISTGEDDQSVAYWVRRVRALEAVHAELNATDLARSAR